MIFTLGRIKVATIPRPFWAWPLLLFGLLGAFRTFDYLGLHLREAAIVITTVLFVWLALSTRLRRGGFAIVLAPLIFFPGVMVLYSYVFSDNTGAQILPSVLAQRDYAFFLIGPIIYLLRARGWKLGDFESVFVVAVSTTVLFHLAAYVWASGPQRALNYWFVLQQGEYVGDDLLLLGVRISSLFALFGTLYFGRRLFQRGGGVIAKAPLALMFGASLALFLNGLPRGLIAAAVAALLIYAFFLSGPGLARLSLVIAPVLAVAALFSFGYVNDGAKDLLQGSTSYTVRVDTTEIAWTNFKDHPWLGYGADSNQSVSFQDVFGEQFYPSDVGLLGVAFQFGVVGLALYICLGFYLVFGLLGLLKSELSGGRFSPFLWALLVVCLTILIASPLQARFIYAGGIPVAALAWGLVMTGKHGLYSARVSGRRPSPGNVAARRVSGAHLARGRHLGGEPG